MKKLFCFFLTIPLLVTSCSSINGLVDFNCDKYRFETYYEDSYFLLDNYQYHEEISLASFANAMSTISTDPDYSIRSKHLTDLWEKEGFENVFVSESFYEKPEIDTIGFAFASKKIDDFNLISVAIRSGGYDAEWANNMTIGSTGNASGFQMSSDIVYQGLSDYIKNYHFTGHTKFWMSGYSRGAAIINLMAGKILNIIKDGYFFDSINTTVKDIYAYCFETPAGVFASESEANSSLYDCIFNLMNINDVVPCLLPIDWGFVRYGQNLYYPDRLTDIYFDYSEREKIVKDYHFQDGAHNFNDYTIDDWEFVDVGQETAEKFNVPRESIHPSMGRFVRSFIHQLFTGVLTRETYAELLGQEAIRELIAMFYGLVPGVKGIDLTGEVFVDLLFSLSLIQTMVMEIMQSDFYGFSVDIQFIFYLLFEITEENRAAIDEISNNISWLLFYFSIFLVQRPDLIMQIFNRNNLLQIFFPHYTELNYSLLRSCDTRIKGKNATRLNDGSYYILHVKTPSSISIYENNIKKNVFQYKAGVMNSNYLSAEKYPDGSVDIYLPKNGDYTYKIQSDSIVLSVMNHYGIETIVEESLPKEGTIK